MKCVQPILRRRHGGGDGGIGGCRPASGTQGACVATVLLCDIFDYNLKCSCTFKLFGSFLPPLPLSAAIHDPRELVKNGRLLALLNPFLLRIGDLFETPQLCSLGAVGDKTIIEGLTFFVEDAVLWLGLWSRDRCHHWRNFWRRMPQSRRWWRLSWLNRRCGCRRRFFFRLRLRAGWGVRAAGGVRGRIDRTWCMGRVRAGH